MKQLCKGRINDRITVATDCMYPAYIVRGAAKNVMIEGGFNLLGPRYLKHIREILGEGAPLEYLFITHSHYDHLGAAAYLKRHIPGMKVAAHERVAPLLRKESVLAMMNRLSEIQRGLFRDAAGTEDLAIRPLEVDRALKEGDEFDLGGLHVRVYEVPGHTRDSLAFFIPEMGAIFPGEAAGVPEGPDGDAAQVEFLSSYDDYIASIDKMIALGPSMLCFGHGWVFTGDDASGFLRMSREATFAYRELIERYIRDAGRDLDRAIEAMTRKEYDEKGTIYQERNAYITNLTAQVKHIASLMN